MKSVFKKISIAVIICFSLLLTACPGVNNPEPEITAGPITATSLKTFVPGKNSAEMAANMTIGWNLGNTFDATGKAGVACENAWGQPTTTKEMIHGIRQAGFVTIRIPVSWHDHIKKGSSTYEIDEAWINRVKEVVDWALEEGLCVIINMHHDNLSEAQMKNTSYGFDVTKDAAIQEKSQKYIAGVWKNVAEVFKDYDHSLVFELLNEPRDVNGSSWGNEWWVGGENAKVANKIIGNYEQAALNEIRATGSKNADRFILVPAYAGSSDCIEGFSLPKDSAESRIMIETHGYTPYVFAMKPNSEGGTHTFTESHKNDINWMLTNIYNNFVSKGIGVVMDEMGVTNKNNEADRIKWAEYYFSTAHSKGIPCLWWDNGDPGPDRKGKEKYGYYNRVKQIWYFPELMKAAFEATGISVTIEEPEEL